jgi:predicted nucleic acid-binding protein
MSPTIIVPQAVERELAAGCALGLNVPDVFNFQWFNTRTPNLTPPLPDQHRLDAGESEVLWLALEIPSSIAILDEAPARRTAVQLGILFTGTLGLLVDAKRLGLIPLVAPALSDLQQHGFCMSSRIRNSILQTAGETP